MTKRTILHDEVSELSRSNARVSYEAKRRKKSRGRKLITVIVSILFSMVLLGGTALAAGVFILNNRLTDGGEIRKELSSVLTEREAPQDPFFMLLLGTDGRPGEDKFRSDTILLARIDPGKKQATLISIPRDTRVKIEGHGYQKINAAYAYGGREGAVKAVSDFAGVPISHFIEVSFEGFRDVVDAIGGVDIDIPVRIDDRNVGPIIIEPGLQTLNGEAALAFCRSRKFPDGDYSRMRHQRMFLSALADQLLNKSSLIEMTAGIDAITKIVSTDMDVTEIVGLMTAFRGIDLDASLETLVVPSSPQGIDGISYVVADEVAWKAMMDAVRAGEMVNPQDSTNIEDQRTTEREKKASGNLEPSQVTVTIKNGSDKKGAANSLSEKVKGLSYKIGEVGNAKSSADKTVVVYKSSEYKKSAENLAQELNIATVISAEEGGYVFNGNVLVLIGAD